MKEKEEPNGKEDEEGMMKMLKTHQLNLWSDELGGNTAEKVVEVNPKLIAGDVKLRIVGAVPIPWLAG